LQTVLGIARRGYFIPYRYAASLPHGAMVKGYQPLETVFAQAEPEITALIAGFADYGDDLRRIAEPAPASSPGGSAPAPRFDQDWFPTLDAVAAYCLLRQLRPSRIVEVGSGHSTRFFARAAADGGFACHITAIDPAPRAVIEGLPVNFIRQTLGQAGVTAFADLRAGDVVSIDSSHILMPGSDVDDFLNRILPILPCGIMLHIHDIFLPDPYPVDWEWRGYNEQNAVGALLPGGNMKIVFAAHYAATRLAEQVAASPVAKLPAKPGALPASLWLRKQS